MDQKTVTECRLYMGQVGAPSLQAGNFTGKGWIKPAGRVALGDFGARQSGGTETEIAANAETYT